MKKFISALLPVIILFSTSAFSQSISNTSNTITIDISEPYDCPTVAPSGTYNIDLAYFDLNLGDWVYVNDVTVTVSSTSTTFTIDFSSVTPAVNFPAGDFINGAGHFTLTKTGTEYTLYWDSYWLTCVPLGLTSYWKNRAL